MKHLLAIIITLVIGSCAMAQITEGLNAPLFTLKAENGAIVRLSDLKGKVVLLNFFATWCGPCKKELPKLEELFERKSANSNFIMLVVAVGQDYSTIKWFNLLRGLNLPSYTDPDQAVFNNYFGSSIPYTILIDKQGIVRYVSIGYDEDNFNFMSQTLNILLQ